MDCYISHCIGGFIAFDENNKIINYKLFTEDERIANLFKIENKTLIKEEKELIEEISNDYDNIFIESNNILSNYKELNSSQKIKIELPNKGGEYLRENLKDILVKIGFSNEEDFKEKFIEVYKKLSILKMKELSKSEDKHLIESINSIDEIDDTISKLIERIREWYGLYFPEMETIKNNETYIKLISENKNKEEILLKNKDAFLINIEEFDENEINTEDLDIINEFAKSIYLLQKTRKNIEKYIENKMESLAPNLKNLLGASLGAKLISHAGGIKRLSTYPSGTVQIMGAEKALFRHLKTGERPPKHGLIFQHPKVRTSKWWNRGKIARTLALKISLSARKDVFSQEFDPSINEKFLEKVEEIEKNNPFPSKTSKKRKEEKTVEKKKKKRRRYK